MTTHADRCRQLLVVISVVLAGCSGFAGSDSASGTGSASGIEDGEGTSPMVTPAPVPDVSTPARARSVAPGLTRSAVKNASALVDAHTNLLSNTSYTVRQNVTRRSANGTLRSRSVSVTRLNENRFHYVLDGFDRDRFGRVNRYRVERFSDGRRVLGATTRDGETTYTLVRNQDESEARASVLGDPTNGQALGRLFASFETSVVGTVRGNGAIRYVVVTTRPQRLPPLTNVTLRAFVDPNGVVRAYRVSYTADRGNGQVDVTVRVAFSELGTTAVERPVWYDAARENATTSES